MLPVNAGHPLRGLMPQELGAVVLQIRRQLHAQRVLDLGWLQQCPQHRRRREVGDRERIAGGHDRGVAVDEVGVSDGQGIVRLTEAWRGAAVTHVVAIERCGRSGDGRPRNMRGVDVSPWTAPLDDLFLGGGWTKLGVGDGGNEIGMGRLPAGLIARTVPNGAAIACVTSCDHLVVAGVSNWGAYGLMAALAVLRPDRRDTIAEFLTAERDLAVTRAIVAKAGAVDGVTARNEATVDGFGPEIHGALIDELRRIAWGQAAD